MNNKYIELKTKYTQLEQDLQNPAVLGDQQKLKTTGK